MNNTLKEKGKKGKKIILILILVILLLIVMALLYIFVLDKKIYIENFTEEDRVLVNTEYQEKKFSICYGTTLKCNDIEITKIGEVNTSVLGEYTLTYSYKIKDKEEKLEKKVIVYDDIKPVIVVDDELKFCKNGNIGKGSYHATDNYDGDLTNEVKLSIEGDKSYLEVTDSSNNKEIFEVDVLEFTSDPVITLKGNNPVYLTVGSSYKESGATASDICDGDLSDKIIITGNVNTDTSGTYNVTYSVENSSLKKTEIKRKVIVQNKASVVSSSSCSKLGGIYLTFDDGPGSGTEKILNVLRDEGVKATFFVTSSGSDALLKREYDEGHVIGLHTSSHNYAKVYASVDAFFNDLNTVSNRVKRVTGQESKIIRFPGGSSNTVSRKYQVGIMTTLTKEVVSRGYRYYDWNVDSGDAGSCASSASSSCVYKNVTRGLSLNKCNMILMHDIKTYTANAISDIIHYGKQNGYTFEVITMDTPMVTQKVNN